MSTDSGAPAVGRPLMILMMRHAEKPDDPYDPDLTAAGKARAEALATYIPSQFGKPDFIFAAAITKHSARPYETVKPLSKSSGVAIDPAIADNDYGVLAKELLSKPKFVGQRIVVCWHHGNIPPLMRSLGAVSGTYPNPWDHKIFNLVLKVGFSAAGAEVAEVTEPF
jgi:phosphohistidine phosphatase SixA